MRILIADENEALAGLLARGLRGEEHSVVIAADGETALARFGECEPDLVVLDLQLPGRGGMEVMAAMRQLAPFCPILVLSAAADASVRTACLDAGAEDCLPKPFSMSELRARCRVLLRRGERSYERVPALLPDAVLTHGPVQLDRIGHRASLDGADLPLTNREFALLEQLLLARLQTRPAVPSAPIARDVLRNAVWGTQTVEANSVDVHLAALRRKLGRRSMVPVIETVRGLGFRLGPLPPAVLPPPIAAVPCSA